MCGVGIGDGIVGVVVSEVDGLLGRCLNACLGASDSQHRKLV